MECQDLKKGDTLICEECGLELKVSKACGCSDEGLCTEGGFNCCGMAMKKK